MANFDPVKFQKSLRSAFERIGKKPPTTLLDKEDAAYEYFITRYLRSTAEAREDEARKRCEELGLFEQANKAHPGMSGVVFDGSLVTISFKIDRPSEKLDQSALRKALTKAGLSDKVIDRCISQSMIENKPIMRVNAALKG